MIAIESEAIAGLQSWRRSMSYSTGDRVRILNGPLAGLTGVVRTAHAMSKCTVAIDGFAAGIYLFAASHAFERGEGPTLGDGDAFCVA